MNDSNYDLMLLQYYTQDSGLLSAEKNADDVDTEDSIDHAGMVE